MNSLLALAMSMRSSVSLLPIVRATSSGMLALAQALAPGLPLDPEGLQPSLAAAWWLPILAYLLGSIPFGYLIVRITGGVDIRQRGSGNIGATNVARVAGAVPGVLTLLLDAGKGHLAVWLTKRLTGGSIRWMMIAALLCLAGHLFPIWLRFQGGRGVATGVGVFLPICWQAVAVAVVIWIATLLFWQYVSLASISAAAALPLLVYILYAPGHAPPVAVSAGTLAAAVAITIRHRPNILRLLAGTETRFTLRRDPSRRTGRDHEAP